jgi:hypothetical protein
MTTGLRFFSYLHDPHCPKLSGGSMENCNCELEIQEVTEKEFVKDMTLNRAQRRKAARLAKAAIAKAKGAKK